MNDDVKVRKGYQKLAVAIILQARKDVEKARGGKYRTATATDAQLFLESEWCEVLQYFVLGVEKCSESTGNRSGRIAYR